MPKPMLLVGDLSDPKSISEIEVVETKDGFCLTPDGTSYSSEFCFPLNSEKELVSILTTRQALKSYYDDSIRLVNSLRYRVQLDASL